VDVRGKGSKDKVEDVEGKSEKEMRKEEERRALGKVGE
jgi:hypothetical protein